MTAPKDLPYSISGRDLVAQVNGMRVQILTLEGTERIPWHFHTAVHDIFVCLHGVTVVETRKEQSRHELSPGDYLMVEPGTLHEVSSKEDKGCKFILTQGVGKHDFNTLATQA